MSTQTKHSPVLVKLAQIMGVITLLTFAVIAYFAIKQPNTPVEAETAQESPKTVSLGQIGHIYGNVYGGTTKDAYDQLNDAATTKDQEGVNQLMAAGLVLPVADQTQAKVIESGVMKKKVSLMSGKYAGMAVYVASEFIQP